MKGFTANPGGRPLSAVTELRARYSRRVPEIFGALVEMAMDNSLPPAAQLGAVRLSLEYLLGRPAISVDTVRTTVNFGELYRLGMIRAGQAFKRADGATEGGNLINGSAGTAGDPENKSDPTS
jgi:hypothetical protein